jgi:archaellin
MDVYSDKFGVYYQAKGQYQKNGHLNVGDVAKVCMKSPRPVGEDEAIQISIIPLYGRAWTIDTITPRPMTTNRVYLFP